MSERLPTLRTLHAAVIALALAFPLAATAAAPPASDQLTFDHLTWATPRRDVRAQLAAEGFTYLTSTPDDFYRGTVDGAGAVVVCVFTPDDQLVFVRVLFDANAPVSMLPETLERAYGKPLSCTAGDTQCRWERGAADVTYSAGGDPYAGPSQASLEYVASPDLAQRYDQQINDKNFDRGNKSD